LINKCGFTIVNLNNALILLELTYPKVIALRKISIKEAIATLVEGQEKVF
jgi:hypothetical protein